MKAIELNFGLRDWQLAKEGNMLVEGSARLTHLRRKQMILRIE
jgi:hypothetical protein